MQGASGGRPAEAAGFGPRVTLLGMRFFSRLGSWLRGQSPDPSTGATVDDEVTQPQGAVPVLDAPLLARLPQASADAFRRRLLDVITRAYDTDKAAHTHLDPSVQVLVLPHAT